MLIQSGWLDQQKAQLTIEKWQEVNVRQLHCLKIENSVQNFLS